MMSFMNFDFGNLSNETPVPNKRPCKMGMCVLLKSDML